MVIAATKSLFVVSDAASNKSQTFVIQTRMYRAGDKGFQVATNLAQGDRAANQQDIDKFFQPFALKK